jgi:uroporphyrinogen-III synthase
LARWVVFTSAHAVVATCGHERWADTWRTLVTRPRIAAVGPATVARLRAYGVDCDVVPARAGGRELAAVLLACDDTLAGVRVLWPRSDMAQRDLPDALTAAGALVMEPEAYRTVPVRPRGLSAFMARLDAGRIDAVAFFSPSAARGLSSAVGHGSLRRLAGRTVIASIGPSTSAALDALGAPATIEAATRTGPDLATAILERLGQHKGVVS